MRFNKWLDTLIEEKDMLDMTFNIEHNGNLHIVEVSTVVAMLKKASKEEQETIKKNLIILNFKNHTFYPYFKQLATGYIVNNS